MYKKICVSFTPNNFMYIIHSKLRDLLRITEYNQQLFRQTLSPVNLRPRASRSFAVPSFEISAICNSYLLPSLAPPLSSPRNPTYIMTVM